MVLAPAAAWAEEPELKPAKRQIISPDETHGLPPGFHAETRPRYGPIIAGSVITVMGGVFLGAGLQQKAESEQRAESAPGVVERDG